MEGGANSVELKSGGSERVLSKGGGICIRGRGNRYCLGHRKALTVMTARAPTYSTTKKANRAVMQPIGVTVMTSGVAVLSWVVASDIMASQASSGDIMFKHHLN